jgi:CubicO group peptidase (beta-lactamase class C family)
VYNNWDFNVLGNIYERLTHKSLYIAFDHHFAQPLGFTDWQLFTHSSYEYRADPMGGNLRYPNYTFFLSARDLARFGELFVNRGVRAGTRLLSQEWITRSTCLVSTTGASDTLFGGYGHLWWIAGPEQDLSAAGIPAGTYSANGIGGNFLTILPGLRAVVAVTTGPGIEESNPQPPDNTSSAVTGYPPFVRNLVDALRS